MSEIFYQKLLLDKEKEDQNWQLGLANLNLWEPYKIQETIQ